MKKVLLPILVLALICMARLSVFADTYRALADFYDFTPELIHDEPRVTELISCNMVLKPKTLAHFSNLCDSAVGNVMYYMNDETTNIQKGPDYISIISDEFFYPGTRVINNSYIGGMISYRASGDFQTKKSNGEKVHLEMPTDVYQSAVIISSKTVYIDMGREYTLSQPTGDQSQPNWTGTKPAYPALLGRRMNWTFRFGTLDNSVSGAFGLMKTKLKNVNVLEAVNAINIVPGEAAWDDAEGGIDTTSILYLDSAQPTPLQENEFAICKKAKRFVMEYNEDPDACDDKGNIKKQDGWVRIDDDQAKRFLSFDESSRTLSYPMFFNAWGRIIAVLEVPTADDCKPVRRTIVKGRIGTKYPGFEFKNMKEGDVLKIYNVNGKKIREITSGTAEGFVWDGRDDSGDWAKSGIYIYQLKVDGKLINGTIAFVY